MNTDLITKLNQPYDLQLNNTSSKHTLVLDCGITIQGKEYTADDLVELLELKEMLKKLHPELFLVK